MNSADRLRPRLAVYAPLALALVALLITAPSGRYAATDEAKAPGALDQVPVDREPPPAKKEDQALEEFLRIYRLEPGQNLKHVPPPRPKGITALWAKQRFRIDNGAEMFGAMTFVWYGPNRLFTSSMTSEDQGFHVRDLPRYFEMAIFPNEIEGDADLLNATIAGDWIYRAGVPAEQMIAAIESRLQRALRTRLTVKFRRVERDVVVVRGSYRYSPLPDRSNDKIEIYGKQLVPGGGGGGGTFPQFLKWVGEGIGRPVVSELTEPPKGNVSWSYNGRHPFTEQTKREDHDEALVLKHLQEQTALTFSRERKPVQILFIERVKAK